MTAWQNGGLTEPEIRKPGFESKFYYFPAT